MNWRVFYAVVMWTNRFWAWGAAYTIVKNRHIGLDIGTGRRAVNVPALQAGRVVIVTKTRSMGWVVVLDTGLPGSRRYHAYCHLAAENLPRPGVRIDRNERVARLASKGARDVGYDDPEYGGTAWDGIHLHLVFSDISYGAYTLNTGATFANPEDFIREALAGQAADAGSRPFEPEEDDMFDDKDRALLVEVRDLLTPGKEGVKFDGNIYAMLRDVPKNTATAVWSAQIGSGPKRRTLASVVASIADSVTDIPGKVWGATLGRGSKRRTVGEMLSDVFHRGQS